MFAEAAITAPLELILPEAVTWPNNVIGLADLPI